MLAVLATGVVGGGKSKAEEPVLGRAGEVRRLVEKEEGTVRDVKFEGVLTWVAPGGDAVVIQQEEEAVRLELDRPQPELEAGQKAVVAGEARTGRGILRASPKPLVDHDDLPGWNEKAGVIFLKAGRHPFCLEYFRRDGGGELMLDYEGPGISRRPLPEASLWHRQGERWEGGMRYEVYSGRWDHLPMFSRLQPKRSGVARSFRSDIADGYHRFGLVFHGFIEVPQDGDYRFIIGADQGSRFYLGEAVPVISMSGLAEKDPQVLSLVGGQAWRESDDFGLGEVEGTVSTLGRYRDFWRFDLVSEGGKLAVEVVDRGRPPLPLLGSRVKVRGVYLGGSGPGGMRMVSAMLVNDLEAIEVTALPPDLWSKTEKVAVADLTPETHSSGSLVRLSGLVNHKAPEGFFMLDDNGTQVAVPAKVPPPFGSEVEVLGEIEWKQEKPRLRAAVHRWVVAANSDDLPLSTIQQVRATPPDLLPMFVRIQGVVTCDQDDHSVTIQEEGSGISCWLTFDVSPPLQMGDKVELTGRLIRGAFAPNLMNARPKLLGKGMMPEPVRPSRARLLQGSLNAQWVEVEGVVQKVKGGLVTLGMVGGEIDVRVLRGGELPVLNDLRGAVVRVQGVVAPIFNQARQIERTYVRVSSPLYLSVLSPANRDPFEASLKRIPELLEFDPEGASDFHRVRVLGQVIYASPRGCYLWDGSQGLRFVLRDPAALAAGEMVEVSGVPQQGEAAPWLADAVVRTSGRKPLPEPFPAGLGELLHGGYEATRIRMQATLVRVGMDQAEQVLELQKESWKFTARLPEGLLWMKSAAPGSVLELTGVCARNRGDSGGEGIESLALLLHSPADILVLSTPPWWTAERILVLAGVILVVLLLALGWIVQLRKKVEQRTAELAVEIHQRELAEQRRAIEEERSRIARDLHDDLGARVTKIVMLAEQAGRGAEGMAPGVRRLFDTTQELTRAMDEVVWTVNPGNDSLQKLGHYLLHYAESYFEGSGVKVRLKLQGELPQERVTASARHHVFLAVKEALRNVLKHSGATECRFEVELEGELFRIKVTDNGRGFACETTTGGTGNGLLNMKHRLERLRGNCRMESEPGRGTTVVFEVGLQCFGLLMAERTELPIPAH